MIVGPVDGRPNTRIQKAQEVQSSDTPEPLDCLTPYQYKYISSLKAIMPNPGKIIPTFCQRILVWVLTGFLKLSCLISGWRRTASVRRRWRSAISIHGRWWWPVLLISTWWWPFPIATGRRSTPVMSGPITTLLFLVSSI